MNKVGHFFLFDKINKFQCFFPMFSGLIKHGEVIATIEISLSNVGTNAYEPDVYGETIKVCTKIDSHGSTAYKIQNFSGKS